MKKIKIIQIKRQDLFFSVVSFQLNSNNPFDGFCINRCRVVEAVTEYSCFANCCVMVLPPPASLCPNNPRLMMARPKARLSIPE